VVTSISQTWTGTKQKEHGVNALQMQHHTAPPQTVIGLCVAAAAEGWFQQGRQTPLNFSYSSSVIQMIALSCVLAVAVNLCTFAIIGKMGPVGYQVVGHAKTCLTLSSGVILFGETMPAQNMLGLTIAVFGVVYYGYVKHLEGLQTKIESEREKNDEEGAEMKSVEDASEKDKFLASST
jgi:solute carrier family 35 protein E3